MRACVLYCILYYSKYYDHLLITPPLSHSYSHLHLHHHLRLPPPVQVARVSVQVSYDIVCICLLLPHLRLVHYVNNVTFTHKDIYPGIYLIFLKKGLNTGYSIWKDIYHLCSKCVNFTPVVVKSWQYWAAWKSQNIDVCLNVCLEKKAEEAAMHTVRCRSMSFKLSV